MLPLQSVSHGARLLGDHLVTKIAPLDVCFSILPSRSHPKLTSSCLFKLVQVCKGRSGSRKQQARGEGSRGLASSCASPHPTAASPLLRAGYGRKHAMVS